LDALCSRYEIDNSKRTLHGALLDAQILADVYLMMTGGQIFARSLWKAESRSAARRPRRQPVTGGLCL
jgi:DNA polymerase-3 subunit epsilon